MNNYLVFSSTIGSIITIFVLLFLLFLCIVSKQIRQACCFCCCLDYTDKISKEKGNIKLNSID